MFPSLSGARGIMFFDCASVCASVHPVVPLSPLLDSIRVMVIIWRLRGNIIRIALCWIMWHDVQSLQHAYMSSSYRSNRLGLSHWDPYAVHRGGCLELNYCNMAEWFQWDLSLISTTNWFPLVLWHSWFGYLTYSVLSGTLSLYTTTTSRPSVHLYILWVNRGILVKQNTIND